MARGVCVGWGWADPAPGEPSGRNTREPQCGGHCPSHRPHGAEGGKWGGVKGSDTGGQGGQGPRQVRTMSSAKSRRPLSERRHLHWLGGGTGHSDRRGSSRPQGSALLVPSPIFTQTTVLSITPISKGLRDEKG